MKKFIASLLSVSVAVFAAIAVCGCGKNSGEEVNLVAISAAQVGVTDNFDYYVVPEPAASAKANAAPSLEFAGDLQRLYGGESGYPQAVIVAKNELYGTGFIGDFLDAVSGNKDWLLNENTSAEEIAVAVRSHLTSGMSPTFTAANLTKQVIINSGINFVTASESKSEIIGFMQELNSVGETAFGTPSDKFFWDGNRTAAERGGNISVYAPDGAPALGIASLLAEEKSFGGVTVDYNVVDPSIIQTFVTGANPKADVCVLPVNLAVKLLGGGEKYKLAATLTHGNLYLLSKGGEKITAGNIGVLKGKRIGVINLAAIPGLTFKIILKKYGLGFTGIA